jgi:predicted enzyme related to lactoylglutathione lyase
VNYFEFVADNPERAKKFYQSVFGWKTEKWRGPIEYWLVTTGAANEPGIDGGFLKRQSPQDVFVSFIEVSDVDKYAKLIEKSGGTIVHPKQAVPGVGWMVYFKDPEGNTWGMMQNDRSAK